MVFLPALFTLMVLAGVTGKIFIDREMSLREGIPIAVLFEIWGILQVRVAMHYDARLESQTMFIAPVAIILLAVFYSRKQLWRRGETRTSHGNDSTKP
jgi:EamA domain-containing membrane protein RarD